MKIAELKPGQGQANVDVEIISIEEPREFEKFGKQLKVATTHANGITVETPSATLSTVCIFTSSKLVFP